jgi:hypothetical protein
LARAFDIEMHPICLVQRLAATRGEDLAFTYSRYEIAPPGRQAAAPRSPVLRVSARDITPNWLVDRLAELNPREEMALHSWVEFKGAGFHIPMIDFNRRPLNSALRRLGDPMAAEMDLSEKFAFFESGRAIHAYSADLIPENAWARYLGELLLRNKRGGPQFVDARWIGHALVRGFGALRWSCNTDRYLCMPHLVNLDDSRS